MNYKVGNLYMLHSNAYNSIDYMPHIMGVILFLGFENSILFEGKWLVILLPTGKVEKFHSSLYTMTELKKENR